MLLEAAPAETRTAVKLEAKTLNVYYGTFRAIKDASLAMPTNRVQALIGPSGCGKSTFLRALDRMHDLTPGARIEGVVELDGKNIYDDDVDPVLVRYRIGMVFQRANPFPKSIWENVAYGPKIHGLKDKHKLDEIVERSLRQGALWEEVKDRLHRSAFDMSGGQQQRLCIARVLAVEPEVDFDGRAGLGTRSDRDREDRRPHRRSQEKLYRRHRYALDAASRAHLRLLCVLPSGRIDRKWSRPIKFSRDRRIVERKTTSRDASANVKDDLFTFKMMLRLSSYSPAVCSSNFASALRRV